MHSNRLSGEKSPYLLQHAHNPVWWQPWGEEAFARARAEGKLIFLSVGYATCHWCHVMERESFESQDVADFLNAHFVAVKVDREEHPDVDQIYMTAVHAMGQRGGWPMSVFLTADLRPFFGGTYWPKEQFLHILKQITRTWLETPDRVSHASEHLAEHLASYSLVSEEQVHLGEGLMREAFRQSQKSFDATHGGFGHAPKFPASMQLRLLLRLAQRTGEPEAREMVVTTLDRMARGGIYDHLGGGFARYSTDDLWLVPHFEKMLYDQALLASTYLEAWQLTGEPLFELVARETLDYVLRDMTHPEGGFYSAEDADSEGEEGLFYLWTREELAQHLDEETLEFFCRTYGVKPQGNFEHGRTILNLRKDIPVDIRQDARLKAARATLFALREKRVHPLKDDKCLTSWNGLMIDALARGAMALGEARYLEAAQKAATFVLTTLRSEGKLLRRFRDGEARFEGTLEDYAWFIQGLLTLHQADLNEAWVHAAQALQAQQDAAFWDEAGGGYFFSPADAPHLIQRSKEYTDGATPNANGVSALNLLRLYQLTLEAGLKDKAKRILLAPGRVVEQHVGAFSQLLLALDFFLDTPREVVLAGPEEAVKAVLRPFHRAFLPGVVLARGGEGASLPVAVGKVPRGAGVTFYVCREAACQAPVESWRDALVMSSEGWTFAMTEQWEV